MPATDSSSSSPAAHTSFGLSILSFRRDQIHFPPPPADHNTNSDHEIEAFQRHAADLLLDLLPDSSAAAPEILPLAWTRHLLDSFLICLEEFRSVLFGFGGAALARPPLDRLVTDFFDRAVKALDPCNALRDGVDLLRQWRKHLAIAAAALASPDAPLGEGQIRRARKALTDLTILMLDDKDGAGGVVGQRNRSFGRGNKEGQGRGHHQPLLQVAVVVRLAAAAGDWGQHTGAPPARHHRHRGPRFRCVHHGRRALRGGLGTRGRHTLPGPWPPGALRSTQELPLGRPSHDALRAHPRVVQEGRSASTRAGCSRRSTRLSGGRGSSWRSLMLHSSPWPRRRMRRCGRPLRSWCRCARPSRMGLTRTEILDCLSKAHNTE